MRYNRKIERKKTRYKNNPQKRVKTSVISNPLFVIDLQSIRVLFFQKIKA